MRAKTAFVLAALLGAAGLTIAAPAAAALVTAAPSIPAPSTAAAPQVTAGQRSFEQHIATLEQMKATFSRHHHSKVCSTPSTHHASCNAVIDQNVSGNVTPNVLPAGYGPADLQAAYQLPSGSAGAGQIVAVVDAFDLPTAEADLATYRTRYGLPACTTANGCFQKVNQNGGSTPPAANSGWGQEIALDLDMVSAACPNCSILLVEADDSSLNNLGTAENTAVSLGATAVSNSWGGTEFSSESFADAAFFNHPGVAITASAGDSGYGVEYPAASPNVIAVGGTSLTLSGGTRGFSETAWSGTGSGCSLYEAKPSWQQDAGCAKRSVVDVSAVSDPATGVAVYDSTASGGLSGWLVFGGTSAAAPFVAGAYELASHVTAGPDVPTQTLYSNPSSFFDVTSGSNGACPTAYLCNAQTGYDGPTGLGTLAGIGAFNPAPAVPPATPSAPTISSAVPGDGKVTLTWQAPADNGGSSITGYVVTPSVNGVAQSAHIYNTSALTEPVGGLANGTAYTFTVSAVNASGAGTASTASSPVTPADAITNKYLSLGGGTSYLGPASGAETFLANGGRSQAYAGGSIYWSASTGAHVVRGVILTKYKALGATTSPLGYPTTDQVTSPDHVGLYNHFAKGAIYWSPAYGAHDVVGAIQTKWAAAGWELGSLGYPTTDSLTAANRVGVYNHFAKGSIYWYPTLGAHFVLGPLDTKYIALGAERSKLGYPVSDSFTVLGGWRSNFQHGYLTYVTRTRAVTVH